MLDIYGIFYYGELHVLFQVLKTFICLSRWEDAPYMISEWKAHSWNYFLYKIVPSVNLHKHPSNV